MAEVEAEFAILNWGPDKMQRPMKPQASWISQETWRLADRRTAPKRTGRASATEIRQARQALLRALQADRWKRVQEARANMESLMETCKVQEAWVRISRWYRQGRGAQSPPATEALDEVSTDRADIYRCRPPKVLRVPILVR